MDKALHPKPISCAPNRGADQLGGNHGRGLLQGVLPESWIAQSRAQKAKSVKTSLHV